VLTTGAAPLVSDQLAAHVVWFDDDAKLPGRRHVLKCGSSSTGAVISTLKHRVAIDTMEHQAATTLAANEIGCANPPLKPVNQSTQGRCCFHRDASGSANGYWCARRSEKSIIPAAAVQRLSESIRMKLPSSRLSR
jgi:hypothetical protein